MLHSQASKENVIATVISQSGRWIQSRVRVYIAGSFKTVNRSELRLILSYLLQMEESRMPENIAKKVVQLVFKNFQSTHTAFNTSCPITMSQLRTQDIAAQPLGMNKTVNI